MGKKLFGIWVMITLIACSSMSVSYASNLETSGSQVSSVTNDVENITDSNTTIDNKAKEEVSNEDSQDQLKEVELKKENAKVKTESKKKSEEKKSLKTDEIRERNGLAAYIRRVNGNVSVSKSRSMATSFMKAGEKYRIDEKILMAIAKNESTFYTNASSPWGYKGLMQTSDRIARNYGYKARSAYRGDVSINIGAKYLREQADYFDSLYKGISAYCYGSGTVKSGNYSKAFLNKILNERKIIKNYLEKNNFV